MQPKLKPTRRETPEARRAQIIEEAIHVIGRSGYNGFALQELADVLGITVAGLLYHFGSKEQLLFAVVESIDLREAESMSPQIHTALQNPESEAARIALLDVFRMMVARATLHPHVLRLFTMLRTETLDQSHPARERLEARADAVTGMFVKLLAPHVGHPESRTRLLFFAMNGLVEHWLRNGESFDIAGEWERLLPTLLPELVDVPRVRLVS